MKIILIAALASALAACGEPVRIGSLLGDVDGWPRRGGGPGDDIAWGVTIDGDGDVYVTGTFQGRADFGGGPIDAAGPNDVFLASYTRPGVVRWVRTYGGSGFTFAEHVETSGGRVRVLGYFLGTMATPLGALDSGGSQALLILGHDESGTLVSQSAYPGPFNVQGKALSRAGDGIALGGNYVGDVDLGTGLLGQTRPLQDFGLLAMLDASDPPRVLWARSIPGDDVFANDVVARADGGVIAVGYFDGVLELSGAFVARGGGDGWIARFDTGGVERWSVHLSTSGAAQANAAAGASSGDVHFTGNFAGDGDVGGRPIASAGESDIVVARIAEDGAMRWATAIGSAGADEVSDVATDGADGAIACGSFSGTLVAGADTIASAGGTDALVVGLDASGAVRFARAFGGPGNDECRAVAIDPASGEIVATGRFAGTANFDGTAITAVGGTDVFVHRFAP